MAISVKDMINRYSPEESEFSVILDQGEEFRFKAVRSIEEIEGLTQKAAVKYRELAKAKQTNPALRRVFPSSLEIWTQIFLCLTLCVGIRQRVSGPTASEVFGRDYDELTNEEQAALADMVENAQPEFVNDWGQMGWMALAKDAGFVFVVLFQRMNAGQTKAAGTGELEVMNELGEGSGGTSLDATA